MDENINYYENIEQHSEEWFDIKAGIPTASEAKSLLAGAKGFKTYTLKKFGQLYSMQKDGYSSVSMDRGTELEPDARDEYERQYLVKVRQIGFIKNFNKNIGCSPDGLVISRRFDDYGIEIKCFGIEKHMEFYLTREPQLDVYQQAQFSMFASNLKRWDIVYYNPDFIDSMKLIVVSFEPDEAMFKSFTKALAAFKIVTSKYVDIKLKVDGKNKLLSGKN